MKQLSVKLLFLIDALGALASAIVLGLVLPKIQPEIGMPSGALYSMAVIPCLYVFYDVLCLLLKPDGKNYLKYIAYANAAYCAFSAALIIYHHNSITSLGLAYFLTELLILVVLIRIELKTASI